MFIVQAGWPDWAKCLQLGYFFPKNFLFFLHFHFDKGSKEVACRWLNFKKGDLINIFGSVAVLAIFPKFGRFFPQSYRPLVSKTLSYWPNDVYKELPWLVIQRRLTVSRHQRRRKTLFMSTTPERRKRGSTAGFDDEVAAALNQVDL